jgi:hypothetical protein
MPLFIEIEPSFEYTLMILQHHPTYTVTVHHPLLHTHTHTQTNKNKKQKRIKESHGCVNQKKIKENMKDIAQETKRTKRENAGEDDSLCTERERDCVRRRKKA